MKEEQEKRPARLQWKGKHAKFYAVIGIVSVILSVAIIWTATATAKSTPTTSDKDSTQVVVPQPDVSVPEQPAEVEESMAMPVLQASLIHDHGFFFNQTLGYYGHHAGVDFEAAIGEEVFCVLDGVVESIYKADKLLGTEITVDHGDGLKTLYRFVDEVEGLQVGATVKRGQKIATVAEPSGGEYKDGAHLHFEVFEEGVSVNPDGYLPISDK